MIYYKYDAKIVNTVFYPKFVKAMYLKLAFSLRFHNNLEGCQNYDKFKLTSQFMLMKLELKPNICIRYGQNEVLVFFLKESANGSQTLDH